MLERWPSVLMIAFVVLGMPTSLYATGGGVSFTNLSSDPSTGITYQRTRSPRHAQYLQFLDPVTGAPRTDISALETALAPAKSRGAPGVCLFDYDGDGDEDIYATNGPGTANSLFSNQLRETGLLSFVDVALTVGADATAQDSSGCASGDLDNDGDADLYVLSTGDDNILYENAGDGTFTDVTAVSGTGGEARWATSATLCDVDADGLLDIVVGNMFDMNDKLPIFTVATDRNEHNQLFVNQGGNVFVESAAATGLHDLAGMLIQDDSGDVVPIPGQPAGISWTVACVDYDLDGDMDVFTGDDQAAIPPIGLPPSPFGVPNADRGLIHVFRNDGTGRFTDVNALIDSPAPTGSWMGLSFADYDADGNMDFFNSNFGDANISLAFGVPALGLQPSRWFLGDGEGGFVDSLLIGGGQLPGVISTPFGWGTSSFDYDNDGDTDILFVGGLESGPFTTVSNPVAILDNDGHADFSANLTALDPADADFHKRSVEHGMAAGDLDEDGFTDFVTVSNFIIPAELREVQPPPVGMPLLLPNPFNFGGPWDPATEFLPTFAPTLDADGEPTGLFTFVPALLDLPDGSLSVERNNAENGHGWLQVKVVGSVDLIPDGAVNRDGIGAVVRVTPKGGSTAMQPILGGSGYAQQDSLVKGFGLGDAKRATIDVLWPGGVRNRLYRVRRNQRVVFPEIPCSIDTAEPYPSYRLCVRTSLDALVAAGVITERERARLFVGAVQGHLEEH